MNLRGVGRPVVGGAHGGGAHRVSAAAQRGGMRVARPTIVRTAMPAVTQGSSTLPATITDMAQYKEMYERSIKDPAGFWGQIAEQFTWEKKWDADHFSYNFDSTKGPVHTEFFKGGTTNMCYNCLDRHVAEGHGNTACLLFEGNDPDREKALTYSETLEEVCRLLNPSTGLFV
ncbi:hypothetical protein FOA52_013446 [Chlamydomonas sp. UWO 241]|nr:hypothetical protein FOA52_013446 [Chlamydomonas sp. UWO 241]